MSGELLLLIRIIVVKFQRDIASVNRSGEGEEKKGKIKKKKKKAGKTKASKYIV